MFLLKPFGKPVGKTGNEIVDTLDNQKKKSINTC